MSEEQLVVEAKRLGPWQQHKFMALVGAVIGVTLVLTSLSLWLYNSSDASQLDLSRPGYERAREQASQTNGLTSFPSSGTLNSEALNEFRRLFDERLEEATAIDAFGGDVLSDKALGIDDSELE